MGTGMGAGRAEVDSVAVPERAVETREAIWAAALAVETKVVATMALQPQY